MFMSSPAPIRLSFKSRSFDFGSQKLNEVCTGHILIKALLRLLQITSIGISSLQDRTVLFLCRWASSLCFSHWWVQGSPRLVGSVGSHLHFEAEVTSGLRTATFEPKLDSII